MIAIDLKSHYSIKQAYGSPTTIVDNAKKLGYTHLALTDYNSVSGCIEFVQACKDNEVKPILGCTFSIKDSGKIICIAKNLDGWKALLKLVSISYTKEFYDSINERPYLTLEELYKYSSDLIAIIGFPDDLISHQLFEKPVYHLDRENIKNSFRYDPHEIIYNLHDILSKYFSSVFLGLGSNNTDYINLLNEVIKDTHLPTVVLTNSCYPNKEDYDYFKLLLCSRLKCTKNKLEKSLEKEPESIRFLVNEWSLPEKLEGNEEFVNLIEEYEVLSKPRLPTFPIPNNNPDEYLTELCRIGWKEKLVKSGKVSDKKNELVYLNRIKEELGVIKDADLSSYFLIVQDYVNFAKNNEWLVGCGRGSAAGCLISYLIGITEIDPVEYGLSFARFYSSSRKGSLPDIDIDFPSEQREDVINYIRNKYGRDRVCHMITFSEIKGSSAIKEVLRINDVCSFEQMNEITKQMPEEGKVVDEMENTGEKSLLLFTLKYRPDKLKDWARYENDEIVGDYSEWFKQAIKLEGTIQSTGKHASALVVYDEPLNTVCPMLRDKSSDEPLAGFSMEYAEKCGIVKFDCLSVSSLSKLMEINNILKERSDYYKALVC